MKSPRLLPVVIFAVTALLLFKGVGLVTGGGYVLTGTSAAAAADGTAAEPAGNAAAPDAAANGADAAQGGPTVVDSSPVIADTSPTLAAPADPAQAVAPAAGAAAPAKPAAAPPPAAGTVAALTAAGVLPGPDAPTVPVCPPTSQPDDGDADPGNVAAGKAPTPGVNCDALASQMGPRGQPLTIATTDAVSPTEQKLIDRLNRRSADLDKLAGSLAMREAVIQAAEKQMQARADALKSLQDQIQSLQDQKKSMQGTQFAGVVKMYETMKPQQAAAIFDGLDMGVLIRVAEAMDPRKMSAVLAQMSSVRAQQLTTQMAADDPVATDDAAAPSAGALPQIVGH